jgi:phosphoribosylpyrophosphate synthetase
MNDTVVKKSELVIEALQYAHDHNLNINVSEDVRKILEVLDPEHKENIDEFMDLLKTSDVFMGMKAKEIKAKEPQLPN